MVLVSNFSMKFSIGVSFVCLNSTVNSRGHIDIGSTSIRDPTDCPNL